MCIARIAIIDRAEQVELPLLVFLFPSLINHPHLDGFVDQAVTDLNDIVHLLMPLSVVAFKMVHN